MTHGEICELYRSAKNKAQQIKILAELNAMSEERIKEILEDGGYKMSTTKKVTTKPTAKTEKQSPAAGSAKPAAVLPVVEKLVVPQSVKPVIVKQMVSIQEEIDEKVEQLKELSQFMENVRNM